MNKKLLILATAIAFVFSLAISGGVAKANNGPADMVLKTAAAKKTAIFPHAKHQEKFTDCGTCHHSKNDDGTKGAYVAGHEEKCETCHNKDMADVKLNNFKGAAHKQCKGCHKKHKADGAPTKCAGCHPKKKK